MTDRKHFDKNRRSLLKSFGGLMAAGGLFQVVPGIQVFNVAHASTAGGFNDYKALVRLEMNGGCDSFNILIPRDSDTAGSWYRRYLSSRGGLINQGGGIGYAFDDILPIVSEDAASSGNITAGDFGLNPEFSDRAIPGQPGVITPGLHTLYNDGSLAFVSNVGSLIEPVSKFEYNNKTRAVPRAVNSHKDQVEYWNLGSSGPSSSRGWGANLIGRILTDGLDNELFPACISLAGQTKFIESKINTTLNNVPLYTLSPDGAQTVRRYNLNDSPSAAFNAMYAQAQESPLVRSFRNSFNKASLFAETFNTLLTQGEGSTAPGDGWGRINTPYQTSGNFDPVNNQYPRAEVTVNGETYQNHLLNQLSTVARLIKTSRESAAGVNATRQIYVVKLRGFDTHANQMDNDALPRLLAMVSQAVGYFSEAMAEINAENDVTLFSSSEFGRTLNPNGSGTDHGWGGVQFIQGGAVNGGKIYGQHPLMNINADDDSSMDWSFSRGQYIPTTATDQMMATLSRWMGANNDDLNFIFPYLSNFSESDLGFLS